MFQNCVNLLQIAKQSALKCLNICKFNEIYLNFEENSCRAIIFGYYIWLSMGNTFNFSKLCSFIENYKANYSQMFEYTVIL